jgi:enhancing lycopene biosynthesis protein 2
MLYLERGRARITYLAPDIPQTDVINHADNKPVREKRNVLSESARICRGNIKDVKSVHAADFDAIVLVGGMGSVKNLSDFMAKGSACAVNAGVTRLIHEMHAAGKPIGSMCLASAVVAKVLSGKKITVTIGGNSRFVNKLKEMGAVHVQCAVDDIVFDRINKIVSTPAMMIGPSTAGIAPGIEKMIGKLLSLAGK